MSQEQYFRALHSRDIMEQETIPWKAEYLPGANIEDARGDIEVILASKDMRSHLRLSGKLRGISGSS